MANILVVTGSVRPNSANEKIVPLVAAEVEKQGAVATIVDLKALDLPFFDAPYSPTAPDFEPTNEPARTWTKLVDEADGVILGTPEYNHTMSPVQMNAIDWIGKEWEGKHVGLVGYGWTSGAHQAHATAREALAVVLKAVVGDEQTNLFFTREIAPDGTVLDEAAVTHQISATVAEIVQAIPA
jgi:NAD(P)H-dependent FMN reductase